MTARRGFLRGLAGAIGFGALPGSVQKDTVANVVGTWPLTSTPDAREIDWEQAAKLKETEERQKVWRLFHRERRPQLQREQRIAYVRELCGGLPPHLASMKSCAPWFLAQRAAIHLQREEDERRKAEFSLRAVFFPDKSEGWWEGVENE